MRRTGVQRWVVGLFLACLITAVPVQGHAQGQGRTQKRPGPAAGKVVDKLTGQDKPWFRDVPVQRREAARQIFLQGNVLIKDTLFAKAAAKYREAMGIWNHPAFHYNLAIAQINLDQPIQAYDSLGRAMAHGPEAIGKDKYEQAQNLRTLLGNQLAEVEVVCDEVGTEVTLDGQVLFTGPGRYQSMVRPGGHQLVASKHGRIPDTKQITLAPGQQVRFELATRLPDTLVTERRWAAWKPWAVVGGGALVMLGAGYFDLRSSTGFEDFDTAVRNLCFETRGCPDVDLPHEQLASASIEQWSARILYGAGAAAVTTGVILLYLNREQIVRRPQRDDSQAMSIRPLVGPDTAMMAMELQF